MNTEPPANPAAARAAVVLDAAPVLASLMADMEFCQGVIFTYHNDGMVMSVTSKRPDAFDVYLKFEQGFRAAGWGLATSVVISPAAGEVRLVKFVPPWSFCDEHRAHRFDD